MWGPLVLAGDLGPEVERRSDSGERTAPPKVPVFVAADEPVSSWIKSVASTPIVFRSDGVGREPDAVGRVQDVTFVPFYRLHRRVYSTYWDLFTATEWEEQRAAWSVLSRDLAPVQTDGNSPPIERSH